MADVYFNVRKLKGKAHKEYVAFVDIMGTRTHMKNTPYLPRISKVFCQRTDAGTSVYDSRSNCLWRGCPWP